MTILDLNSIDIIDNANIRLDKFLFEYKFVKSRTLAQKLIKSGFVFVNNIEIRDVSFKIDIKNIKTQNINIEIKENILSKYVSRGALKLLGAITNFNLKYNFFKDKICLDIGSSTGGFTQVLLQFEAKTVYAIDVGTDQFDKDLLSQYNTKDNTQYNIKNDRYDIKNDKSDIENNNNSFSQIKLFENTDIRDFVKSDNLNYQYKNFFDIIVSDISFISLYKILSDIKYLLKIDGHAILLLKPQFEIENKIDRNKYQNHKGLIRQEYQQEFYDNLKSKYLQYFDNYNIKVIDIVDSPIDGGDGNKEFLIFVKNML